ncbi:hypothetical protein OZX73_06020 [Bifidobacterium sp. ESL0775]|uniref:hypothetical protein n=1 Tax=Bifidobacterium sp. ESL0775 TaxID=2983230 RepID=UPI0023F906D4|nr:hypothetical protein [Bifidobacterium sp. ESL0775]WEV68843.1 hypothetical protein OZX73_06020 [Bifidobacterium sp. ESL0775]
MNEKRNTRKIRPLLAGTATLLLAVGMLAGGVADAATPASTGDYQAYDAADSQLVDAMSAVNGSVKQKSDADAQAAAQAAQQAQEAAQAQAQSAQGSTGGGRSSVGFGSRSGGWNSSRYSAPSTPSAPAPSYQPAPSYTPSAPSNGGKDPLAAHGPWIDPSDGSCFAECF